MKRTSKSRTNPPKIANKQNYEQTGVAELKFRRVTTWWGTTLREALGGNLPLRGFSGASAVVSSRVLRGLAGVCGSDPDKARIFLPRRTPKILSRRRKRWKANDEKMVDFWCRFFTVYAEIFTVYKGHKRWKKNISLLMIFFTVSFSRFAPPLDPCKRREKRSKKVRNSLQEKKRKEFQQKTKQDQGCDPGELLDWFLSTFVYTVVKHSQRRDGELLCEFFRVLRGDIVKIRAFRSFLWLFKRCFKEFPSRGCKL